MATISSARTAESADFTKVTVGTALVRLLDGAPYQPKTEDIAEISPEGMQQSAIAALSDASRLLLSDQLWSSTKITSKAQEGVSVRSTDRTPLGKYQIQVDQLASGQVTSSQSFSSLPPLLGLGTLNIEIGSWDSRLTTFAPNPNWPKASVVLGPRNDSLDVVRDKINAAGIGVTATVVSDATGSRLVLRSTSTGAGNGFKITTDQPEATQQPPQSEQDFITLKSLGFDPPSDTTEGMSLLQPATDARALIDDKVFSAATNVIENETGLSLTLKDTTDSPITVNVARNQSGIQGAIQYFAQSYNSVLEQGGNLAESIKASVQRLLTTSDGTGETGRALAKAGITASETGELKVKSSRLLSALQQSPETVRETQGALAKAVLNALPSNLSETPQPPPVQNQQDQDDSTINTTTTGTWLRQRLLNQYQMTAPETGQNGIKPSAPQDESGIDTL